jgi:hypothetical protein
MLDSIKRSYDTNLINWFILYIFSLEAGALKSSLNFLKVVVVDVSTPQ